MSCPAYTKNPFVGLHPEPAATILDAAVVDLQFWTWDNIISPFWRWYWNDQPGAYVAIEGKRWELHPDSIVIVPPGINLASHTDRRLNHFFIDFILPKTGYLAPREPLVSPVTPLEKLCIESFMQGIGVNEPGELWRLAHLARLLVEHSIPYIKTQSEKIPAYDPRIERAIQLIQLQPLSTCPVSELAKTVGMSTGGFGRLFSKSTGQSVKQYQLSHWVEASCNLLLNRSLTIEEVALQCGFFDRFHYSKTFTGQVKCSPAAFRKKYNVNA